MQFPNPYLTQGYQNPVYTPYNPMPQQQNMTHVIQTSIIQVDSVDDLNKFQLNAGQNQMFNTSINGIQQAITSGFGDMQTALCGGFAGVNAGIANGFAQAEIAANSRQMADMNQMFGLSQQFAQCCCDNRLATCQTQNIVQNEGAATRSAIQNGVQAVLDKMCQDKIDAKNEKIVELNNRINFLEENNYVQNSLTAQTQYLISQLKTDTPAAG